MSGGDGDAFSPRARATDGLGHVSAWGSPWQVVVLDSTPPTITLDAESQVGLAGQIVGPAGYVIAGSYTDTHSSGEAQICRHVSDEVVCDVAEMSVSTQVPAGMAYAYDDLPAEPVDLNTALCLGGGMTRTFVVSDDFSVGDADLGFAALHPNREALFVDLISPAGDAVCVIEPSGVAFGLANYDVWLDNAATGNLHNLAADDVDEPCFDRAARPDASLSAFYGTSAQGVWTLRVCDLMAGLSAGMYHRARLSLSPQSVPLSCEGTWRYALPTLDGADGVSQTLTIHALDAAGNRTAEAIQIGYLLDVAPPALTVSTYVSHPGGNQVALAGTVGDGGGVAEVYVWGVGPDGFSYREVVVREGAEWTYALGQGAAGTHTLWLEAYDLAGNLRTAGPFAVTAGSEPLRVYLSVILKAY